jgi:hypothetical protein
MSTGRDREHFSVRRECDLPYVAAIEIDMRLLLADVPVVQVAVEFPTGDRVAVGGDVQEGETCSRTVGSALQ